MALDGRPAGRRPASGSRLSERLLQVGERQKALAAAVGGLKERVELFARDLAAAVAIEPR